MSAESGSRLASNSLRKEFEAHVVPRPIDSRGKHGSQTDPHNSLNREARTAGIFQFAGAAAVDSN
jgi:hypothetical protein